MRKYYLGFCCLLTLVLCLAVKLNTSSAVSPHIVISQFQTGGGGTGTFNDEFIEIFNRGADPIDLNGYRLVYRSATGSNDVNMPFAVWTASTIIPAGGYYLIASTSYDGAVPPNLQYNPTTCQCSMGAAGGGLALRLGDNNIGAIIDSVGWGTATNIFVEGAVTAAPAANNSQSRLQNGCQDTDSNAANFTSTIPAAPRNASATPAPCSGGGTTLFAAINANPSTVSPGGNTLLTVTVIPATTPPSTSITVTGNLADIGGNASQVFFDNGTNGDVASGDNVFSFLATVPVGTTGGIHIVTAAASDAQARVVSLNQSITVNAPLPGEDPLIFGNPSNATPDIANENNYLMEKPQYSLSYNRGKATANCVAWRLDSSWIGSTPRQDDFRPDTTLPAGWYQVLDTDYSGSGYDRGHMCPSGDRTNSIPNNSATFLMTNMVPQLAANNQGPWEEFESYCRILAGQGNEIYIMSGPSGNIATIAQGRVVVPAVTWKVVLVIPNGSNDLQRVGKATRAFGIIVPNQPPLDINAPWRNFRVTVDAVEHLTGYDFLNAIPKNSQELIERRRDTQ
ncbi:MAG: DNA/RNA non-specific endonuclease [Pyrinomonadaceae bacterium]